MNKNKSTQTNAHNTLNVLDLISRQAAIDALDALCDRECEYSKKQRSVMCGACHLGSAFDVVEQLPSAQPVIRGVIDESGRIEFIEKPERKRGKWINRSLNILYPEWERYKCSVCGKNAYSYDFCPNCGADMRGEQDE